MPSKNKRSGSESQLLQLLRGGKPLPEKLVRQGLGGLQQKRKAQFERRSATQLQMAKYLSQFHGPSKPSGEPPTAKALDGLLGIHKRLGSRKLAAPPFIPGFGGILGGAISVKVTPPFDYDDVIPTVLAGNAPTLTGSASKDTGQMSVSCSTSFDPGFNGGSMYASVGVYFHPLTSGTLTLSAAPKYSFEWWTNSIPSYNVGNPPSAVRSYGEGSLNIYSVDVETASTGGVGAVSPVASETFYTWEEDATDQVLFDFGSDLQTPVSVQADVNHTRVYLLFVEAQTHVEGAGWPDGSLAGAVMSVTVPSLTYDFEIQPLLEA